MSNTASPLRVPVLATVDVAVIGATTGAVAAALAAREAGASVIAISDRSYFGEEVAGSLELWRGIESGDPLLKSMAGAELKPAQYKRAMENALLREEVPFLFLTRPVALLRENEDGSGAITGLVLASRTALYAVKARSIVDASAQGLVARLAGVALPGRRPAADSASLMVLGRELSAAWEGRAQAASEPMHFENIRANLPGTDLQAYRLTLDLPETAATGGTAQRAALEHQVRTQAVDRHFIYSADLVNLPPAQTLTTTALTADPLALDSAVFQAAPGLLLLGGLLPLDAAGLQALARPEVQAHLGRKLGALAARENGVGSALPAAAPSATGNYQFATGLLRPGVEFVNARLPEPENLGQYDVVVAGGGTGGASAGISAARAGARTVVLEVQHGLGGVGTLGLISNYYYGNRVGFTTEIDRGLHQMEERAADASLRGDWAPEVKMHWYNRTLSEAGGEAWFRSFAYGVRMEGNRVTGVLVSTPYGCGLVETSCVVDATGNADIAAAAGAPCRLVGARHVGVQGAGLSPRRPGTGNRNSDYTFVDDNDVLGVTHAFVNARAKFPKEFDNAPLVDTRERRQIQGEVELSPLDFLADRKFPDTINIARSNFDTHGFTVHPVFLVTPPDKEVLFANVPFRCLLPQGIEGVLVTGLGMSAHRDAIPVIRMQPDVQNQGYAAGLAAAMAAARNMSLRDLPIRELQQHLVEKQILPATTLEEVENFPLPADVLERAVAEGPEKVFNAAVLFAHPEASIPLLLERLRQMEDVDSALVLGILGRAEAAPVLAKTLAAQGWDEGWNFTGMGQFGMSMSRVDALIVALGRTGEADLAVEPIAEKIAALAEVEDPDFSHCRAVALATASLKNGQLASALADLLARPGLQGHAHLRTVEVVKAADENSIETLTRSRSLRELYLARGLFLAGDSAEGLGRRVLETYANDLRGHYARHAAAILAGEEADVPATELA